MELLRDSNVVLSIQTQLPASYEEKRRRALAILGQKWLLHSANAPRKLTREGILPRHVLLASVSHAACDKSAGSPAQNA